MQSEVEWKVPVQHRSRRRFDDIVAAAGVELDEVGWQRFTMESVAKRTGSSIGSIYRYFPGKQSLVAALIDSHSEQLRRVYGGRADDDQPFEDVVQAMIEEYEAALRRFPGLMALVVASLDDHDAYRLFQRALGPAQLWMAIVLQHRLPRLDPARLRSVAAIIVHTIESLYFMSARPDSPERKDILREARLILRGYMNELQRQHNGP